MKALVTGSHRYSGSPAPIITMLDGLLGNCAILVVGDAKGIDDIAVGWAYARNKEVRKYRANWDVHGLQAGPIRNQEMIDFEHHHMPGCSRFHAPCDQQPIFTALAFPGEDSIGTWDMVNRLQVAGIGHTVRFV